MHIIGSTANIGLFHFDGKSVFGLQYRQYPTGLSNNFRADTITRQYSYIMFHINIFI